MYSSTQDKVAEEVACRVANLLHQIVRHKRVSVDGSTFYIFSVKETSSSWPAALVQAGRESELAEAVVAALGLQ